MSPACRAPNAAIPPIRPRQPRPTDPAAGGNVDPHSTAHEPGLARPTRPPTPDHTQPQRAPTNRDFAHRPTLSRPTGGFAPLDASPRRVAGVSHPYGRNSPHLPPPPRPRPPPATTRLATAHEPGLARPTQPPTPDHTQPPPHPRSDSTPRPRPRASQSPATTGGNFGLHPPFSQNEIRPTQFAQTVTN